MYFTKLEQVTIIFLVNQKRFLYCLSLGFALIYPLSLLKRKLQVFTMKLKIHLQLYSILREKLPPEANGHAVLQLNDKASLHDLLAELDITRRVVVSVNGEHESDMSRRLQDGDRVKIFSSISGG